MRVLYTRGAYSVIYTQTCVCVYSGLTCIIHPSPTHPHVYHDASLILSLSQHTHITPIPETAPA